MFSLGQFLDLSCRAGLTEPCSLTLTRCVLADFTQNPAGWDLVGCFRQAQNFPSFSAASLQERPKGSRSVLSLI